MSMRQTGKLLFCDAPNDVYGNESPPNTKGRRVGVAEGVDRVKGHHLWAHLKKSKMKTFVEIMMQFTAGIPL